MQERNLCSQAGSKVTAVEENQGKWLLLILTRFWGDTNSTGIHSNWIVCHITCLTYTFHFSSTEYKLYNSNAICMSTSIIMETANLRDFLENLFDCSSLVSHCTFSSKTSLFLFTEAAVTPVGNQSQVDLFACTSTSFWIQIFFYKSDTISSLWHPWWELDVLTFQWQINYWRVDQRHQRHVSRLGHPSLSPDYLSARFAPQFFFFANADFCSFFPQCGAWSQANMARQVYTLQFVCLKKEQIYRTLQLNYWANLFS